MAEKQFLDNAYGIDTIGETQKFYNDWAASYDKEITENGYATPRRCAKALAKFSTDKSAPLLDIGCGTGISGLAFASEGFTSISGCDLSPDMLEQAKARDGLYIDLWQADLNDPFPFDEGTYGAISAVGVLATGHAPPETIPEIVQKLSPNGLFVLSLNDHTLQDPGFEARIADCVDSGTAELIFKDYGDHLPGIDLKSTVYVLRKR